jgi:hypothetical protein
MGDPEPFAAFVRRVAPEHAHLILRGGVEAARELARWTQHSPSCARHDTTAEDCTCGLDQAWAELEGQ